MVEWGWVSSPEMGRAVATQIKDIIYSVFSWNSGSYRFEREETPVPADLVLELRTAEVIYEGARRVSDLAAIEAGLGAASDIVALAEGGHLGIPITQEDGYILARIDGRRPLGGIVSGSSIRERRNAAPALCDAPRGCDRETRSPGTSRWHRGSSSEPRSLRHGDSVSGRDRRSPRGDEVREFLRSPRNRARRVGQENSPGLRGGARHAGARPLLCRRAGGHRQADARGAHEPYRSLRDALRSGTPTSLRSVFEYLLRRDQCVHRC